MGHNLTHISGFISFFGGVANLALAATVSMNLASTWDLPPRDFVQYSNNLVAMFFITALLCLVGGGLGRGTAVNPLKKET